MCIRPMNTGHDMKTLISYKLLDEAVAAVEAEAERSGGRAFI